MRRCMPPVCTRTSALSRPPTTKKECPQTLSWTNIPSRTAAADGTVTPGRSPLLLLPLLRRRIGDIRPEEKPGKEVLLSPSPAAALCIASSLPSNGAAGERRGAGAGAGDNAE